MSEFLPVPASIRLTITSSLSRWRKPKSAPDLLRLRVITRGKQYPNSHIYAYPASPHRLRHVNPSWFSWHGINRAHASNRVLSMRKQNLDGRQSKNHLIIFKKHKRLCPFNHQKLHFFAFDILFSAKKGR